MPWFNSTRKRLVRSPKLYIRDSGLFHCLQSIKDENSLLSNPMRGFSWEGFALEQTCMVLSRKDEEFFFWATHNGAEMF